MEERKTKGKEKEKKRLRSRRKEKVGDTRWRRAKLHAYVCNGTECSYGTGSILVLLPSHVLGQAGREKKGWGGEGDIDKEGMRGEGQHR